jgi:predicted RNA-binding Zn-ribbon protein involved in translation (DUF1610 family)
MIEQDLHKVCPVCDGEYRYDIERCADCGVPLVHPQEIALRDARELPSSPVLVLLCSAPIDWVQALARDLERQGVRYRIDRRRAREEGLLTLYVRRQDWQAAKEVGEERARIEEPFRHEDVAEPRELRREAPSYKVCPQCGGEYRLDIKRCADCGTVLVLPANGTAEEEEAEEGLASDLAFEGAVLFTGPRYELPPSDDLVCLCCRYVSALRKLSLLLDEARIFHRLEPAPYGARNIGCILVLPADANAAEKIDNGFSAPPLEGPALFGPPFESPLLLKVLSQSQADQEVRDDGLELGSEGLLSSTCRRCGATLWLTAPRCPNCGVALPPA